jgi:hypothetical protein
MSTFDALRGLRRTTAIGLLSIGTIAVSTVSPVVAHADCTDPGQVGKNSNCMATNPGTPQGCFGSNPASVAHTRGAPPSADIQPSTMRAICATSACFLIEIGLALALVENLRGRSPTSLR